MVLLAIRHFVTAKVRGRIWLVGDAMGVWFGMVRFNAKAKQINEITKEVAMHLAPLGHDLIGVHIWSEANTLADLLSRVAESGIIPPPTRGQEGETPPPKRIMRKAKRQGRRGRQHHQKEEEEARSIGEGPSSI